MAKRLDFSAELLDEAVSPPQAARSQPVPAPAAIAPAPAPPPRKKPIPTVPLQIRIPAPELKAIKRAALESDKTVSDFMLTCFHAHMRR
jgi:hypothetical protein